VKKTSLRDLTRENLSFLLPYFIFLLIGGIYISLYSRSEIHIFINERTHGLANTFFRLVTNLGDGLTVGVVALLFLLYRLGNGLLLALSGILAGVLTQLLKHTLFSDWERPKKFFEGVHQLYLVPGVANYSGHTFPSGHAASAFALYFSIALLTKNKIVKMLMFLLALTVAFSRVYLSQHFLNDVYAGSLLGILAVIFTWFLLTRSKPFAGAEWMNKSVLGNKAPVT
jgi:membrane-associated phospholipid phosphatase